MTASWRNPAWVYHGAASHADATAFRRRQRARSLAAREQAQAEAAVKVRPIKQRVAK